jgi:exonuclease III
MKKQLLTNTVICATLVLGSLVVPNLTAWAAETACFPETTSVATTTFKTLAWNLHGEALSGKILPGEDWVNPAASVTAILGVINSEKPNLVVFDAVHTKFEKRLKDEMAKSGYVYSYINTALPKTYKDFKKAIFSKEKILEYKTHTSNFKQILSGENYAANHSVLEVKIDILNNVYSIFAGFVGPGRNQSTLNHNYFAQNVYSPLIQSNKPHFILGDFNMFLDYINKEWFKSVYLASGNFPSASFYVNNYKDVCVVYPGAGCEDSTPPADYSGRIDQTIFRDYTDKQTIKVVKSYIRQDTENNFQISDHFPIVAEFLITGTKVTPGYCNALAPLVTVAPTTTVTVIATTTATTTSIISSVIVNNTILGPKDCSASWPSKAYPKEGKFSFAGVHDVNYMSYRLGENDVKDARFVCFDKKFYDCGWERKDSSVSKRVKDKEVVGSWKCDLKNKKWNPVVISPNIVGTTVSTSSASSSNSSNYLFPLNYTNNLTATASSSASSSSAIKLLQYFIIPGKNVYPDSVQTFSLDSLLDIKTLVVNWSDNKTDCQAQVSVGNINSGWKDVSSPGSLSLSNVGKADRISISAKNAGTKCSGVVVGPVNLTGYTQ